LSAREERKLFHVEEEEFMGILSCWLVWNSDGRDVDEFPDLGLVA
jgi:hypothetical protein